MLDFATAVWSSAGFVPGILLALALAPSLRSPLAVMLAVVDLWLLLEIFEVAAKPAYAWGSEALPRLVACTIQVVLAIALFQVWWRMEGRAAGDAPLPLGQRTTANRRPINPPAPALDERKAA